MEKDVYKRQEADQEAEWTKASNEDIKVSGYLRNRIARENRKAEENDSGDEGTATIQYRTGFIRENMDSATPVSYTHLTGRTWNVSMRRLRGRQNTAVGTGIFMKNWKMGYVISVSYTHLDVYKRQQVIWTSIRSWKKA